MSWNENSGTVLHRYIHFRHGVTPILDIYPNQIPPGLSIVVATRYPEGERFIDFYLF